MRNILAVAQGQNAKSTLLGARSSSIYMPMRRMSVQCSAAAMQAMLLHSVCLAPPTLKSYRACFSHDPPKSTPTSRAVTKCGNPVTGVPTINCRRTGSKIRLIELLAGDDPHIHCRMHIIDLEGAQSHPNN